MESALTVKGQATLPKAVRDHLRLQPGDRVRFFIHPDGTVVILPKLRTSSLRGMVSSATNQPVSLDALDAAIADGAAGQGRRRRGNRR